MEHRGSLTRPGVKAKVGGRRQGIPAAAWAVDLARRVARKNATGHTAKPPDLVQKIPVKRRIVRGENFALWAARKFNLRKLFILRLILLISALVTCVADVERGIMQIKCGKRPIACCLHEFCKFEGSASGATRINKWAEGAPETHTAENKKCQGRFHFKWTWIPAAASNGLSLFNFKELSWLKGEKFSKPSARLYQFNQILPTSFVCYF